MKEAEDVSVSSVLSYPRFNIYVLISVFLCVFCIDISGVPGTGKTATVHAIVRELKRMAEESVRLFFLVSSCLAL